MRCYRCRPSKAKPATEPPTKKLLANYSAQPSSSQSVTGSALQEVNRYLEMDDDDDDCLAFWCCNQVNLNKLVYPAIRDWAFQQQVQQWSVFSAMVMSFWDINVIECRINYCQTAYVWNATNCLCLTDYWLTDQTGGVSPPFVFEIHCCSNSSFLIWKIQQLLLCAI